MLGAFLAYSLLPFVEEGSLTEHRFVNVRTLLPCMPRSVSANTHLSLDTHGKKEYFSMSKMGGSKVMVFNRIAVETELESPSMSYLSLQLTVGRGEDSRWIAFLWMATI